MNNFNIPPLGLYNPPTYQIRKFHVGDEIAFEDMIPGQSYYHKDLVGLYGIPRYDYDEIILVEKMRNNEGNLTGAYRYQIPAIKEYYESFTGEPMPPVSIPQAPLPQGLPNPDDLTHMDFYKPDTDKFYKVATIQRGRHLLNPLYKEKRKKEVRRKHLNTTLNALGFSTNVGTGPANIIRKYLNLQAPRGVKASTILPRRKQPEGGKRKTRRRRRRNTRDL